MSEECSVSIVRELFQHFWFLVPWGSPVFAMSPLKKHSQQPEWLLVSDHTSKEGKKTPFTQGFILKFPYVLCLARALGNSRESSRHCCPRAIPPTKGTFSRCCRATIFAPRSIFRERDLVDTSFCLQHAGIAPRERGELVTG